MRQSILARRIAKDKKKKDEEKAKQNAEREKSTQLKIQSTKLERKMSAIGTKSMSVQQREDLLMRLLREWAERVEQSKHGVTDVWDENSQTYYDKSQFGLA